MDEVWILSRTAHGRTITLGVFTSVHLLLHYVRANRLNLDLDWQSSASNQRCWEFGRLGETYTIERHPVQCTPADMVSTGVLPGVEDPAPASRVLADVWYSDFTSHL